MSTRKRKAGNSRELRYLALVAVSLVVAYFLFRNMYFAGETAPFAQEMILVFVGAVATIYLTATLLNRQTELELHKEGQVLLFQQKHAVYMSAIEKVAEIVENSRHDPDLIDELRVISHKLSVVGSGDVVAAFRLVLDRLIAGLASGALNDEEAEDVMDSVAKVTLFMREDMLMDREDADSDRVRDVILSNSRRVERLSDLENATRREEKPAGTPK